MLTDAAGKADDGRQPVSPPGAPLRRQRRVRPCAVAWPNWKAGCRETGLPRLERGKGREALPIATKNLSRGDNQ